VQWLGPLPKPIFEQRKPASPKGVKYLSSHDANAALAPSTRQKSSAVRFNRRFSTSMVELRDRERDGRPQQPDFRSRVWRCGDSPVSVPLNIGGDRLEGLRYCKNENRCLSNLHVRSLRRHQPVRRRYAVGTVHGMER
jgi:hypothetical protein